MVDKRLNMDAVFAALSDPTRRAMLAQLALGETTVSELAAPYRMSLPAAAKHIAVLESAGLLHKRRQGRTVQCRLDTGPLRAAQRWIGRYEQFWSERLDALQDFLDSDA